MSCSIRYVRGDYGPPLVAALRYKESGLPLDVSSPDVSVFLKFWKTGSTTTLQTMTGVKLAGGLASDGTVDTTYTTPGSGGRVRFDWPVGALDVPAGQYEAEIYVQLSASQTWTVYDRVRIIIRQDR